MTVWIKVLAGIFSRQAISTVIIILSAFILYSAALVLKFLLCNSIQQKAHTVCFKPQHFFKLIVWNCFKIIGAVKVCASIQCSPGRSYYFKMLVISNMIASLEHHMF